MVQNNYREINNIVTSWSQDIYLDAFSSREKFRSYSIDELNVLHRFEVYYNTLFTLHDSFTYSPACTKKHVYLPYRGTIPFWFYLVPLRLVSIFLNVGRVEISYGLLPTRFSTILL